MECTHSGYSEPRFSYCLSVAGKAWIEFLDFHAGFHDTNRIGILGLCGNIETFWY